MSISWNPSGRDKPLYPAEVSSISGSRKQTSSAAWGWGRTRISTTTVEDAGSQFRIIVSLSDETMKKQRKNAGRSLEEKDPFHDLLWGKNSRTA